MEDSQIFGFNGDAEVDAYLSERARQWGTWGVFISWGFLLLTLAEHFPVLVLSPCTS